MTDAHSKQVALQNLREFQEMSYADVYALIRKKRFDEATVKYCAVLESLDVSYFDSALSLKITTPHDNLLDCMSEMASKVAEPEKIRAVGFDLSAHVVYNDHNGRLTQGIEVSLYSEDVFDFINASDERIRLQCEAAASEWQGAFLDIESCALDGLGELAQQFADHAQKQNNLQGIIVKENGSAIVDPVAISRHVAKLLLAIEYHRYMAEFVAEVEVPSEMVFIIGEHDEIEVPIVFYRVGQAQSKIRAETPSVKTASEPQVLKAEETPSIYQDQEPVDADVTKDDAIKADLDDQAQAEPKQDLDEQPEAAIAETEIETVEQADEEPISAAKASLGMPLQPKTFGQLSNKLFNVDDDKDGNAEKSV